MNSYRSEEEIIFDFDKYFYCFYNYDYENRNDNYILLKVEENEFKTYIDDIRIKSQMGQFKEKFHLELGLFMSLKNIRLDYMNKLTELYKIKSKLDLSNNITKTSPKSISNKINGKRSFLPVRISNSVQTMQNKNFSNHLNSIPSLLTVINSETEPETTSNLSESSKIDTKPLIPHINCHLKNRSIRTLAMSMSNLTKFSRCQSCNNCWLLTTEKSTLNHRSSKINDNFSILECKYLKYHKYLTRDNKMLTKSHSFIEIFSNSNMFKNDMTEALIRHFYKDDLFEQKCKTFVALCPTNQQKLPQT